MNRDWWHEPLHHWSQALGFHYRIRHISTGSELGPFAVGTWWQQGDQWCIALDTDHFACLSGLVDDTRLRDALSWTLLQAAGQTEKQNKDLWAAKVCERCGQWGQQSVPDLVHLLSNPDGLRAAWQGQTATSLVGARLEGRLVWLHWSWRESSGEELATADESLRTVVEAYQPHTWLGPVDTSAGIRSALLWWPPVIDLMDLQQQLSELLGVVEEDAMVFAQASAGQSAEDVSDWPQALLTTVLAWHQRSWLDFSPRVWCWGQRPVLQLFQALPKSVWQSFLDGALQDSQTDCGDWPEEWRITLHGILAANLNVSEAARLLYLHRNTLLNRIERIRERTGYDIRRFEDAAVLWLVSAITRQIGIETGRTAVAHQ